MIALLLLGFGIVAFIQIPALVRKQWWRELISFLVLWTTGLLLSILLSMGVHIPPVTVIIGQYLSHLFPM
ncbi:MAG TPA: hypothetical protein VN426_08350 [Syntrophomonadaceae bacterium]|nr:hypothetical protein [Syntrophomonadaceae bacterium]